MSDTATSYKVVEMETSGKVLKVYGNFTPMSEADAKKYPDVDPDYLKKQATDTQEWIAARGDRPKATPTSSVRVIATTTVTTTEIL
jgi:hypothetical protein